MGAYSHLARYYRDLFPVSEALAEFLRPFIERARQAAGAWLDVGCGAGALLGHLRAEGVDAFGMDPEPAFAREAAQAAGGESRVRQGGMLDLDSQWGAKKFLVITCLGNTLAHTRHENELERFFSQAARRLEPEGVLITQTVNFDAALAPPRWEFPLLRRRASDGTELVFERRYEFLPPGEDAAAPRRLLFHTRLSAGDQTKEDQTPLIAWTCERQRRAAAAAGFERIAEFGDFRAAPWAPNSPATILVCSRRLPG